MSAAFKPGDRVKCVEADSRSVYLTEGDVYTVKDSGTDKHWGEYVTLEGVKPRASDTTKWRNYWLPSRFEKVPDPKPVRRDPVFAPGDRVQYFGGAGFYQTKHVGRTATVRRGTDKAGCVDLKWDDNGALCMVYAENLRKINGKRPSMGWIDEGLSKHKDAVDKGLKDAAPDIVALPPHYRNHPSGVECITITQHMNFCRGNAIKYVWRAGEKGGPDKEIEDLRKARQYLDIEIKRLESAKND